VPVLSLNFFLPRAYFTALATGSLVRLQFRERLMTVPQTILDHQPTSRRFPSWIWPFGLSLLLSLIVVTPFFFLGTASGHDFEFHIASWFDVAYQWKQGILYPRWTAWTNHGFGEPRFIFYPPLSWMLGAALTMLLPDVAIPIVFIVLVQTFAGISAYFLLRNLTTQRAATLGAAVYVINPNSLLMIYIRSDFAELLACAFFPLLLLPVLRLSQLIPDHRPARSAIVLFALPFAAVWLSNAPAAVIATYSMALILAWAAWARRSCRPLLLGTYGFLLGFGLTSFYLVPAAFEQRWVSIGQALSSGLLPYQNFLFTAIDDPEHTWFNWIASACALALILLLAIAVLGSRRFRAPNGTRNASIALLLLGAAATALTLHFTLPLWIYLPKLRFVQFPWRWMSMIALAATCFLAFTIEARRRRAWLWFTALCAISLGFACFQVNNTWWDEDEMPTMRDAINSGSGYEGVDEYDPLGDDHADLPQNAPLAKLLPADADEPLNSQAQLQIPHWTTRKIEVVLNTPQPARIALRILNYPAWRVLVNGKQIQPERMEDFDQMVVPVSSGVSDIRVEFTRTTDRTIGDAIFVASASLALFLLWLDRKRSATTPRS